MPESDYHWPVVTENAHAPTMLPGPTLKLRTLYSPGRWAASLGSLAASLQMR